MFVATTPSARQRAARRQRELPHTGKQYGIRCPQLTNPHHGTWQYVTSLPAVHGKRRQARKGGFATKREAQAALAALVG